MTEPGLYWHVYHDSLVDWCYDYEEREQYILAEKPPEEVELRIRLFQPVRGELPKHLTKTGDAYGKAKHACDKAWAARGKAWDAYYKAGAARGRAWDAFYKALKRAMPYLSKLHKKECAPDCPWNGSTIFSEQRYSSLSNLFV